MSIPKEWLICPIEPAEVEGNVAETGAPDSWLRQWRTLLGRLEPGDELCGSIPPRCVRAWPLELADEIDGFEPVRDREVLEWIKELEWTKVPEFAPRIVEDHAGFALVRDGEILDWIGEPP